MTKGRFFCSASAFAALFALGASGQAQAQTGPTQVEEVVVTGSFIRGTPEDAALPVDVISQEDIEKQGSPSTLGLIKNLSVSSGVLGDTNAYFAEQAPWVLRKTDVERMNTVLYVTLEVLRIVAILAQPVMPQATGALLSTLGQPEGEARQFAAIPTRIVAGTELPAPSPVFPKYEEPAGA